MTSISSVSAPPPLKAPDPSPPKPPAVQTDAATSDAGTPPVQAALPPGQGTRVNQIA
jgi:hypothetical protein